MQEFHGLANYFHRVVLGWAKLVAPLQKLLKKDLDYEWTEEANVACTWLKHYLCNAPVLALPDFKRSGEVICDASGVGLGAVLVQDGRPTALWAKRLSTVEQATLSVSKKCLQL